MPLLNINLFKFSKKPPQSKALDSWKITHKHLARVIIFTGLFIALISPYRYIIKEQAIATPEKLQTFSNKAPGVLSHIYVKPGQKVSPGEKLLQLKNPEIEAQAAIAQLELEQTKLQLSQLKASPNWNSQGQTIAAQEALKSAQAILASSIQQTKNLTVKSTTAGTILTPNLHRLTGRFIPEATPLIKIGNIEKLKLLIPIPEPYIRHLSRGDKITGTWVATGQPINATISYIPDQKAYFPQDYFEAIYTRFGGPAPKQQFQSVEDASENNYPIYLVEASIETTPDYYHQDMRAQIKISGRQTLFALRLKELLSQLFN